MMGGSPFQGMKLRLPAPVKDLLSACAMTLLGMLLGLLLANSSAQAETLDARHNAAVITTH